MIGIEQVVINGELVEEWDDANRVYTDYRTNPPTSRPYTAGENSEADIKIKLTVHASFEERISALEAWRLSMEQEPETPVPGDAEVKTMEQWGGVWPAETLLREEGAIYRNISGMPLTSPPSKFSGGHQHWSHLFVLVTDAEEEPEPVVPDNYVGPWDKDAEYKIGDVTDRNGIYYKCLVAHGAIYQGTWGPPQGSVWSVVGPVA